MSRCLKGLPDAPVSRYLSYLGLMVEAEAPPAVPSEWPQDLTHVTPIPPKPPPHQQHPPRSKLAPRNQPIPASPAATPLTPIDLEGSP